MAQALGLAAGAAHAQTPAEILFWNRMAHYEGRVGSTIYWGSFAWVLSTLGQATEHAMSECRRQGRRADNCGIRLTFCADGSHKN